jgi:hypothetical protein
MTARTNRWLDTFHIETTFPILKQTRIKTNSTQKLSIKIASLLKDKKEIQAKQEISAIYCHLAKYLVLSRSCTHQNT